MQYEFEDVIAAVDDVTLLVPQMSLDLSVGFRLRRRLTNALRHRAGRPATSLIPASHIDTHHDLFFAVLGSPDEIAHLARVRGWRRHCDMAMAFLTELWTPWLNRRHDLRALRNFDHVFVFGRAALPGLAELTGVPCTYLPVASDTLRFAPLPRPPSRVIDVYSYGRRNVEVHSALVRRLADQRAFYLFQTTRGGRFDVEDHQQHRLLLAATLQRSRYCVIHKINDSAERRSYTGGEEGLSSRYFEAAAAGAVIVGSAPDTADFAGCFDWPDAVTEIDPHDDAGEVLAALDAEPARTAAIRRHGVAESLRRHDWVHRWANILEVAGLSATAAVQQRVRQCEAMAHSAEQLLPPG